MAYVNVIILNCHNDKLSTGAKFGEKKSLDTKVEDACSLEVEVRLSVFNPVQLQDTARQGPISLKPVVDQDNQ